MEINFLTLKKISLTAYGWQLHWWLAQLPVCPALNTSDFLFVFRWHFFYFFCVRSMVALVVGSSPRLPGLRYIRDLGPEIHQRRPLTLSWSSPCCPSILSSSLSPASSSSSASSSASSTQIQQFRSSLPASTPSHGKVEAGKKNSKRIQQRRDLFCGYLLSAKCFLNLFSNTFYQLSLILNHFYKFSLIFIHFIHNH